MSYFWSGYTLHNFLFKGLSTESIPGLLGICVGIFSVALLYEGLRSLKSMLLQKYSVDGRSVDSSKTPSRTPPLNNGEELGAGVLDNSNLESLVQSPNGKRVPVSKTSIFEKIYNLSMASSFHTVYVFLGFSLMNAVMTFNIYVFLAAILGIGLGYFLFYDCSRLKFPYGIPKSDLAQSQSLLSPEVVEDDTGNMENERPNGSVSAPRIGSKKLTHENELVVQAEIYNVPSTNGQV